jgi:hypothetical protein
VLPKSTYPIKVGRGKTGAAYRLNSVNDALDMLAQMANS